jgi:TonB family protein
MKAAPALALAIAMAAGACALPTASPSTGVVSFEPVPGEPEYFRDVRARIGRTWTYPCTEDSEPECRRTEGTCVLDLRLAKSGALQGVTVATTSGDAALDRHAIEAVRAAAPFPPVPDALGPDAITLRARFVYKLEPGRR